MQEMWVQSLGQENPLEKESNSLQHSCLGNPMDRGAWQAIVHVSHLILLFLELFHWICLSVLKKKVRIDILASNTFWFYLACCTPLIPFCDREGTCSVASLCDPMDWSPPGSSVHGILQARILEWVAMPSSRGSS